MKIFKNFLFLLIVFVQFLFSNQAFAFAEIDILHKMGDINYIHQNEIVPCGQVKKGKVLGCARHKKRWQLSVDCRTSTILLTILSENPEIEIYSGYPKNSCEYKEVLDHELTHFDIHEGVLGIVLQEAAQKMLKAYDDNYSHGCQAAQHAVAAEFNVYASIYYREDEKLNNEFDHDDSDSIIKNCKKTPNIKFSYIPIDTDVVSKETLSCSNGQRVTGCFYSNGKRECIKGKTVFSCVKHNANRKGGVVGYLSSISAEVKEVEKQIEISSVFPKYSCEYEKILEAENAFLKKGQDLIKAKMGEFLQDAKDVYELMLQTDNGVLPISKAVNESFLMYNRLLKLDLEELWSERIHESALDLEKVCGY